ncbi:hypothetical protein VAR608DRAFT_3348 [Variovorax sp. HW608]|uniref:hypothetical protein n=1 Tax=Variovorax sp. HW608 TaxID=1034889 RepID=UPI00081FB710|nr:hypothetical protein [Variovorax sp. HW608]SCK36602.1 hypothetical protein VAR608DRAFT_3348 [Variovorax sp. HW608]
MSLLRVAGGGSIRALPLLGIFRVRRRARAQPARGLFLVNVKVGRGSSNKLSSGLAGAYVSAYVTAADKDAAQRLAITKLTAKGFEFLATQGPVARIELDAWPLHVAQSWPEFIDELPRQHELAAGLEKDMVFFGPFVGYERSA